MKDIAGKVFGGWVILSLFFWFSGGNWAKHPETTNQWWLFPFNTLFDPSLTNIWFAGLTFAVIILFFLAVSLDDWFGASTLIGCYLLFLLMFSSFNVVLWVLANPLSTICYVAGYILIGIAWATFKLYILAKKNRYKYDERKRVFLEKYNATEITEELKEAWLFEVAGCDHKKSLEDFNKSFGASTEYDRNRRWNNTVDEVTKVVNGRELEEYQTSIIHAFVTKKPLITKIKISNYKKQITTWIELWPFSILHTLFADLFTEICQFIYHKMIYFWQNMVDSIFRDIQKDLR